jgi:hypothetical protein
MATLLWCLRAKAPGPPRTRACRLQHRERQRRTWTPSRDHRSRRWAGTESRLARPRRQPEPRQLVHMAHAPEDRSSKQPHACRTEPRPAGSKVRSCGRDRSRLERDKTSRHCDGTRLGRRPESSTRRCPDDTALRGTLLRGQRPHDTVPLLNGPRLTHRCEAAANQGGVHGANRGPHCLLLGATRYHGRRNQEQHNRRTATPGPRNVQPTPRTRPLGLHRHMWP